MSRPGRKRKQVAREPNGRPQRPTQAVLNEINEREAKRVKTVVLMQPHRRGNDSEHCVTALGRFWLRLKTDNKLILLAGEEYAGIVRRWRAAWVPGSGSSVGEAPGSGDGPSLAMAAAWERQIDQIEAALTRASDTIRRAVTRLVIDDRDLETRQAELDALLGLRIVAIELKLVGPDHPFR